MSNHAPLTMNGEPVDADRWLYVHEGEVVGAMSGSAVDLVHEAGLVPHLSSFRGGAPDPDVPDEGRVRLFVDDEDRVRAARSG